jgi:Phage major capsid protein E
LTTGLPFFCEDHTLKEFVADEDVENAITPTDPFMDATENVSEGLLIDREIEVASLLTSTANLTQNITLSGTSQWNDFSNSDPIAAVRTGKQTIHASIHQNPNTLVMGRQVWDKLIDHPAFLERVKYSQLGVMTPDLMARIFEVDRIIVGGAGKNTAKEGQTDSMSYIWGKDSFLAYIAPTIKPKMITLGLTYKWQEKQVERLRGANEEDRKGTYVRIGNAYYDQNIVSASCAYLFKGAVA